MEKQYGSWTSPISSKCLAETNSITEIRMDRQYGGNQGKDTVFWSELHPAEQGSSVVYSYNLTNKKVVRWTQSPYNVTTSVHEYGGGAFFVQSGVLYFSNGADNRWYVQTQPSARPEPLFSGHQEKMFLRFADGDHFWAHSWFHCFVCVQEKRQQLDGDREPTNSVVLFDRKHEKIIDMHNGPDFVSTPRFSPDGQCVSWIQWNHPDMPWTHSQLWCADYSHVEKCFSNKRCLVGSSGVSVTEQGWYDPDTIFYIGDENGYWNLKMIGRSPNSKPLDLFSCKEEIGGPHWQFGEVSFSVCPDHRELVAVNYGKKLQILNIQPVIDGNGEAEIEHINTGYTHHTQLQWASGWGIFCKAASPTKLPALVCINVFSQIPASWKKNWMTEEGKELVQPSGVEEIRVPAEIDIADKYISFPEEIEFDCSKDSAQKAYGYYYPPKNGDFVGLRNSLPPLLMKVHGGPTSQSWNFLNLSTQFFTSRGFAVFDINHRGSTGYGREYLQALAGRWGEYDVEDCYAGANHLVSKGLVNKDQLCISGGSAGGFTTLAVLTFGKGLFAAGASYYGICDLAKLMEGTHKFESHYLEFLLGPPDMIVENCKQRSPISFVDMMKSPVAFLHGDKDFVVPLNQAELMVNALKLKGIPCELVVFEGEGHGFKKAENRQKAIETQFQFYKKLFKF